MDSGVEFKVCGVTRLEHCLAAAVAGASYLGFNFYPKSPRFLGLDEYARLKPGLPELKTVAVVVNPSSEELSALDAAGFDYFQIHFPLEARDRVLEWSEQVGKERLWIAPKLPLGETVGPELLGLADTVLWDAYKEDSATYGGTGRRSDWQGFRDARQRRPDIKWILAGGLSPENALEALRETGARCLDFNSGLETEPGVKDRERILQLSVSLGGGLPG